MQRFLLSRPKIHQRPLERKLGPTMQKGIHSFTCSNCNKKYVGETARSFSIRHKEHCKAAEKGHWNHSGLTQHTQHCGAPIAKPEILSVAKRHKTKGQLKHHLRVEESMWIRRLDCGPHKGMNEDYGSYVKTDIWTPLFKRMDDGRGGQGFNPSL